MVGQTRISKIRKQDLHVEVEEKKLKVQIKLHVEVEEKKEKIPDLHVQVEDIFEKCRLRISKIH